MRLVDFHLSRVSLHTVPLDDTIVVAAKATALPRTAIPDATLIRWATLLQLRGGPFAC